MVISPACTSAEVKSAVIPALIWLSPKSPAERLTLRPLILILPPPVPVTSISAKLLRMISALATSSGKLKLPSSFKVTFPAADKAPNSMFPLLAVA